MIAKTFPGRWSSYLETLTLQNTIIQIDKVAFAGSHGPRDVLIRAVPCCPRQLNLPRNSVTKVWSYFVEASVGRFDKTKVHQHDILP